MKTKEFEQQLDEARVVTAIREAEAGTSGEIRVFVSQFAADDVMADARREFVRLGMARTPLRNGVLLYFAPKSQKFAIIGDEGIHLRCGEPFWKSVAGEMEDFLKTGKFTEAVVAAVTRAGAELAKHFPKHSGDRDDLANAVVRD